jgi:hypothetical protein
MTNEVDISKVLIEGDTATIMGVKYKRVEEPKKPEEEAYKDWWGEYPGTEIWTKDDEIRWVSFSAGYNASQEPKKEQKWDVVRESVKWCEENPEKSVEDYLKPQGPQGPVGPGPGPKGVIVGYEPTPQEPEEKVSNEVEKLQEKNWYVDAKDLIESGTAPPEPTSTVFRQKLFDGIKSVFYDPDYERTHWKMKVNMAVDEVLTHFYDILPEPQSAAGSQNVDVEFLVDGYNDCLNEIKSKLR